MRRTSALAASVVTLAVLAGMTACSATGSADSCGSGVPSGDASITVEATGKTGAAPDVSFPQPLVAKKVQRSVLEEGDGTYVQPGDPVLLEATIADGTTGEVLQQTSYAEGGGSIYTVGQTSFPGLGDGLECARVGSRIAIVAPPPAEPSEGEPADTTVLVVDVLDTFPARADGADQLPVNGMPSVVTAPDGAPGITIPNATSPSDYRRELTKKGDGDEVGETDAVVAKFIAIDWDGGTVADSSWSTGEAVVWNLADPAISAGVTQSIVGQRVGSQVLAILPPDLAGTPEAPATSTQIYVIDILGVIDQP